MADKQIPTPVALLPHRCVLGEGPIWNPVDGRLYWTDIPSKTLHSCREDGSGHTEHLVGREVGGLTIQVDGSLLLFMDSGSISCWRPGSLTRIIEQLPEFHDSRFNDVIAAPSGQVFCGTMPLADGQSKLFRLDSDGTLRGMLGGLGLANGMGFSCDGRILYLTDSKAKTIWRFAFDWATASLTNRQPSEHDATPDGLTVDAEGCVWSARWGGHCVVRYDKAGQEIARIMAPAENITSLEFGGKEFGTMYLSSARSVDQAVQEDGGKVFSVNLGVRGKPEYLSTLKP